MPDEIPEVLRYDYIKSNLFRMIHADGVIGGPTPKGLIFAAFWNERSPIPQQVAHEIVKTEGGPGVARLGRELTDQRVTRQAVVRETEVGVLMDVEMADRLRGWLEQQIQAIRGSEAPRGGA